MFVAPVTVAVFEHADSAGDRTGGIIGHLGNEKPTIGIPDHGDGSNDVRLGGHKFGSEIFVGEVEGG